MEVNRGIAAFGCPALLFCFISLSGCGILPEKSPEPAAPIHDSTKHVPAPAAPIRKHPYVKAGLDFPHTYYFEKDPSDVWDRILALSKKRNEEIILEDRKKGEIVTSSSRYNSDLQPTTGEEKGLICRQRITVESKNPNSTFVSNKVLFFESHEGKIGTSQLSLPAQENIIRGIFFSDLAFAYYGGSGAGPARKPAHVKRIASKELVHIVQGGESLGSIALTYTGNFENFKAIADHNGIPNPNALYIGQELRIPASLVKN